MRTVIAGNNYSGDRGVLKAMLEVKDPVEPKGEIIAEAVDTAALEKYLKKFKDAYADEEIQMFKNAFRAGWKACESAKK